MPTGEYRVEPGFHGARLVERRDMRSLLSSVATPAIFHVEQGKIRQKSRLITAIGQHITQKIKFDQRSSSPFCRSMELIPGSAYCRTASILRTKMP
jgi:hypothetical protein